MNKLLFGASVIAMLFTSSVSFADDPPPKHWGMDVSVGAPEGAAMGVSYRPNNWLRFTPSLTYNTLAPGLNLGVGVDPVNFPVAPLFLAEVGHSFNGHPFWLSKPLEASYSYEALYGGLGFGSQRNWRFYLLVGMGYLQVNTNRFQETANPSNGVMLGNPSGDVGVVGLAKLGLSIYF